MPEREAPKDGQIEAAATPNEELTQVEFVVREDESAALDWAALRVVGPRDYDVGLSMTDADVTVLRLQFSSSPDEARTKARALYGGIRGVARLPPAPDAEIQLVARVAGVPVDADEHLFEAQRLREEKRYELAVIEAQTFCEMHLRYFAELVAARHSKELLGIAHAQRRWSLLEESARTLFAVLLNRSVTSFPDWEGYRRHVQRRNEVVHRGVRVTEQDADESISVVVQLRFFVERTAEEALAELAGRD